ncbi:hypothetical protein BDZ45DRAFT_229562 [Acephala macrosclerotiorum]|nr:hypothetical protein BDZ45DRAFT_229562 [Acephala macrosclerotiorum]
MMPPKKNPTIANVIRRSTIHGLSLRYAEIYSSKVQNCALDDCQVFNSTLIDCDVYTTDIHESQVFKSTLNKGCTITMAPLKLSKFTPELRLMVFKHIIKDQAASHKSSTLPRIKALRVCKESYYNEALEVYYKLVPFPLDQRRWGHLHAYPTQSIANRIRCVDLNARNFNASMDLWYTPPKFPAVAEVHLHGLAEHSEPQRLISSWLTFCQDRFDALSTFRLTFPITDEDDASSIGY